MRWRTSCTACGASPIAALTPSDAPTDAASTHTDSPRGSRNWTYDTSSTPVPHWNHPYRTPSKTSTHAATAMVTKRNAAKIWKWSTKNTPLLSIILKTMSQSFPLTRVLGRSRRTEWRLRRRTARSRSAANSSSLLTK